MSQSNVEICRAAYEAFGRGDIETAFTDLDENCVWRSGSELLPAGGTYHGKSEILGSWLPELGANFQDFRLTCDEFLDVGDRVVVLGTERATVAGTDIKGPFCHVWTYRDGKAVEGRFFGQEAQTMAALSRAPATST